MRPRHFCRGRHRPPILTQGQAVASHHASAPNARITVGKFGGPSSRQILPKYLIWL